MKHKRTAAQRRRIMTECEKQLQQEREKLDRLVDEALKNGTPIDETYEIMSQTKKVEALIERLEGERGRNGR
jgi:hypothetical protein